MLQIRVGLPYASAGQLAQTAAALSAPTLISAGSLFRPGRGFRLGAAAYTTSAALDSAGFMAMMLGGYRWTVADYVEFVATNGGREYSGHPFPWAWWSAMDFCVEPEIASNRSVVESRIRQTEETWVECFEALEGWRREGVNDVPDPMPILQGRTPDDYVATAERLAARIDEAHPCVCPEDPEACEADWHREHRGLPALVGVGSMCRRPILGDEGILAVLGRLDAALPKHVQLHLFGVKGDALDRLGRWRDRVASVDSMAWDVAARYDAKRSGQAADVDLRSQHLRRWYSAQVRRADVSWARMAQLLRLVERIKTTPPAGATDADVETYVNRHLDELWEQARHALP